MNKLKDKRPWGKWKMLHQEKGMWIKKITVKPGQRLSLQYHLNRREKWTIVKGYGCMTLDLATKTVIEGEQIDIGYRTIHRISNPSENQNLVIIEIALGFPDEKDIIRLEDDYGRSNEKTK